jgi:hypothetical protein
VWLQHSRAHTHFTTTVCDSLNIFQTTGLAVAHQHLTHHHPGQHIPSPDVTTLDKSLWNIIKGQMAVDCYHKNVNLWRALKQGFTTFMPQFCIRCGTNRPTTETDANERSHCHTGLICGGLCSNSTMKYRLSLA